MVGCEVVTLAFQGLVFEHPPSLSLTKDFLVSLGLKDEQTTINNSKGFAYFNHFISKSKTLHYLEQIHVKPNNNKGELKV